MCRLCLLCMSVMGEGCCVLCVCVGKCGINRVQGLGGCVYCVCVCVFV